MVTLRVLSITRSSQKTKKEKVNRVHTRRRMPIRPCELTTRCAAKYMEGCY